MKRRLLLVGWDAADWKVIAPLIDAGKMPHTARLVEGGVMGNLATLNPVLSPMLWTSIATGKRPYKHGIHGFSEPDPDSGLVRPITNLSRTTKAIWNILNQEGKKSFVLGWWPSSPAEPIHGAMVSDHFQQAVGPLDQPWPMRPGTVHPPERSEELAALRIHPHEIDGDMLRNFIPRAPEIDQAKDPHLHTLAKIFAECSGIHAAATHLIGHERDWDFAAVYYDAIDHFSHAFMRYHPPRLGWVSEEDFALYQEVITGAYRYHDMMLGALLELAGPETTVILMSDHGFHPDHLRPESLPNEPTGPAAEHRQFGIFVAHGPGIKRDDLVFGASVLDVTPTILSLYGLPVGRDMDGRALTSIYEQSPEGAFIDSWDAVPGDDGRHPPDTRIPAADSAEAIRQLVDLGYIDEPNPDRAVAVEETTRELRYNLARAYGDGGLFAEAIGIFARLWERWPEESRFGVHLLQAQMDAGQVPEARETMTLLRERKAAAVEAGAEELKTLLAGIVTAQTEAAAESEKPEIDWERVSEGEKRKVMRLRRRAGMNPRAFAFLEGSLLHLEGRCDEALAALGRAAEVQTSNLPGLHLKMGEVCLSKRDWELAGEYFARAIDLDPLSAQAHFGLARVAVHCGDWAVAAHEALASAGQHYHHAPAHYLAGCAFWKLRQTEQALACLQRAIAINPVYPAAHRTLASFHRMERADWPAHLRHRRLAREASRRILEQRAAGLPRNLHPMEVRETFGSMDGLPEDLGASRVAPTLPPLAETVVVVTGLPRSGTSMMMQMLVAGGIPARADDHRPADASNERGYLELDAAKRLATDASWLGEAKGHAVKLVAQLVPSLPTEHFYRFVMMHRPLSEIVSSQRKMLERLGKPASTLSDEALKRAFHQQVMQVRTLLNHLRKQGTLDVLDLKYHDVLDDPQAAAAQLAAFLAAPFDVNAAASAVAPQLRHERE